MKLNFSIFFLASTVFMHIKIKSTCFAVCLWIHDNKLRPEFTDASSFKNRHQPPQVF